MLYEVGNSPVPISLRLLLFSLLGLDKDNI
jgi:hypothetical protein